MSILVGLLARQVMRHAELSGEMGRSKYRSLFVETDEYAGIRADVDRILVKCGYGQVLRGQGEHAGS